MLIGKRKIRGECWKWPTGNQNWWWTPFDFTQKISRTKAKNRTENFKLILSLSFVKPGDDGWKTSAAISAVMDEYIGPETKEGENNLHKIFCMLHIPIFNMNRTLFQKRCVRFENDSCWILRVCSFRRYRFAFETSFCLRNGQHRAWCRHSSKQRMSIDQCSWV